MGNIPVYLSTPYKFKCYIPMKKYTIKQTLDVDILLILTYLSTVSILEYLAIWHSSYCEEYGKSIESHLLKGLNAVSDHPGQQECV